MRENHILEKCIAAESELLSTHQRVLILAVADNGNIVLLTKERNCRERWVLEMPCGDLLYRESQKDAAIRVLLTETGLFSDNLQSIGTYNPKGSIIDIIHLFSASNLTEVRTHIGMGYDRHLIEVSPGKLGELIHDGMFCQEPGIKAFTKFYLSVK